MTVVRMISLAAAAEARGVHPHISWNGAPTGHKYVKVSGLARQLDQIVPAILTRAADRTQSLILYGNEGSRVRLLVGCSSAGRLSSPCTWRTAPW